MFTEFPKTLVEMVEAKRQACPDDVCFYSELEDGWAPHSHAEFYEHVQSLCRFLQARGIKRGDRVGILSRPCYEWEVADKAIMYLGGTVVGMDCKSSSDDLAYIMRAASLTGLFVEDDNCSKTLAEDDLASLEFVCSFAPTEGLQVDAPSHRLWNEIQKHATGEKLAPRARPDDIGVIVFTSGTTGKPKGIPLKQHQLTASLPEIYESFRHTLRSDFRTLAWVPLFNSTGRLVGSINYFLGVSQYFVKDPQTLFDKLKKVEPNYLVVVPRLVEKVYEAFHERLRERPRPLQLALRALLALRRRSPVNWFKNVTDRLLIGKLRRAIWGSKLQFLLCGSAPVEPKILRFFDTLGIPTYEVYGLSETGVIAMNRPGSTRYGSVGHPLDMVDVKLAEDGEILAKTVAAAEAYWGDTASQEDDLYNSAGYLKTGDLGELRDGYLYITGRKNELIKTSTGQRISPASVEAAYRDVRGVDQIVVIGNGRKYLTALVAVDQRAEDVVRQQYSNVEDYLMEEFQKRAAKLSTNQQIKRFAVLPRTLSVAEGEITPTLKVRRTVVEKKFKTIIDSMYTQSGT